jgi:hypothetical protein
MGFLDQIFGKKEEQDQKKAFEKTGIRKGFRFSS